jgi:hypothetical protein
MIVVQTLEVTMLTLQVSFEDLAGGAADDRFSVFWNVDRNGIASGDISLVRPMNSSPMPVFPGGVAEGNIVVTLPPIHHGALQVGGKRLDKYGNYAAGDIGYTTMVINSFPEAPVGLTYTGPSSGRPTFRYTRSPQIGVDFLGV